MWYLLYIVVPTGKAGEVIRIAERAGSQGGTVLHGKGIGKKPKSFLSFEVEPMREIVWIIVEKEHYREVSQALYSEMDLSQPGHGILFAEPLSEVHGLVNQKPVE